MNTPSTFLYDLVKNLTRSERRYIRLNSGAGERDYMHLLKALQAQKTYDEEKLIEDHKGANFTKHLAVNKRYLYELLLRSLARFGQKTIEDNVYEKIAAARVLMEKGLFRAASSELRKGWKMAEKYELFELQILLCDIEKRLLFSRQSLEPDEQAIHKIYELERRSLQELKSTNEYWYLFQRIVQFQMQHQKIQNEEQIRHLDGLTRSAEFLDRSLTTNFKSKLYYFQANAVYQFMLGNVEAAYEINRSFLDLLDENPHFLKLHAERYLATLNNILIDSLVIGKYDILEEEIERLTQISERSEFKSIKHIESRIFRQRYLLLLNWCLSKKDSGKALEWIPDIEEGLHRFGKKIEKHHRITFYYLIAYLLFQNRRYEQALRWNNLIVNDPKEDVVKEIYYFARVLNLLIHYELRNYLLLESLLLSTPKYLKARRPLFSTEKTLFRFLTSLLKTTDPSKRQTLISDFKNKVSDLSHTPSEKRMFGYLDLRWWKVD
ncbi:MAG: hypothetical protein KDC41_20085 [Saprospiraceae bacterium]|nr:hypothetical protein [Saprospiraceae bacterium]